MISLVFFFFIFFYFYFWHRKEFPRFFFRFTAYIDCQGSFFLFFFCFSTAMPSCPQHRNEHAATTRCTTAISTNPRNG